MAENTGPLTEDDLKEINLQLANLNEVERQLDKAARAGIDVSAEKAKAQEARAKFLQIRQAYFPGRI